MTRDNHLPPSTEYQPGDPLGDGKRCPNKWEQTFGKGTVEDPLIYWTCIVGEDEEWREAHHVILRAKAKEYGGFPCIVLRAPCHNTVTIRDNETDTPRTLPADPHLTIFMGQDIEHCQVQGHIYVIADRGTPLAIATPQDRKIVHEGYKPVSSELWTMGGNRRPKQTLMWGDASQRTRRREFQYASRGRQGTATGGYLPYGSQRETPVRTRDLKAPWRTQQTQDVPRPPATSVVDFNEVAKGKGKLSSKK